MNSPPTLKLTVIWQSLVVKSYRSFFKYLGQKGLDTNLVAPEQFMELGFQKISCEPFEENENIQSHTLKSFVFHTQIVFYRGLRRILKRSLKREKKAKQIVFCMAEPYSLTALAVWVQARIVLGKDFSFILFGLQNISKSFSIVIAWIQKFLFQQSAAIAVCGPEQTKVLRQQGYRGKIIDFPLWYDSSLFKPISNRGLTGQQFDILLKNFNAQKIQVGFVGALVEQKGVRNLMSALSNHLEYFARESNFLIVGKGQLEEEVRDFASSLNTEAPWIYPLGFMPHKNLPTLFNNLDILVVPSLTLPHWKEQFGRIIIEAQACGCLVLGSNSGHIPQLIDADCCFAEDDPEQLAGCLKFAVAKIKNDRKDVRNKQLEKAALYSDHYLANKFMKDLEEVSKKPRGS